jgi:hypothetical protein
MRLRVALGELTVPLRYSRNRRVTLKECWVVDLVDRLKELSGRIQRQKDSALTEEAAKTAFVLPFLQALGYDVFDPSEVIPELTADHGVKKGEKVDYAIMQEGRIVILIECKPIGADLEAKHAGQLFRYFAVTDARFGVLTDGTRYLFFSDLEKENRMDDRPFFEFDLFNFSDAHVQELKKFTKTSFDLETIISTASNLKYHKALLGEIRKEFESPSEDLIRMLAGRVYSGRLTQQVKEQFAELTTWALRDYIRGRVNERLQNALETGGEHAAGHAGGLAATEESDGSSSLEVADASSAIETTADELKGFRIVQAIAAEIVDPDRIVMRDAKSYCAILLDDNNRRPVVRLHFSATRLAVTLFGGDQQERVNLDRLVDLYKHRQMIVAAIRKHEPTAA